MVVENLRAENQRLNNRNEQLMEDVLNLGRRIQILSRERIEAESSPEEDESATAANAPDPEADPESADRVSLLYVNAHWHYVILNRGSDQGIEVGDYGSVLREGRRIAIVKVTDTKPGQSVAELDLSSLEQEGVYPATSDEVEFR